MSADPKPPRRHVSAKEAAHNMGVSDGTVRRWAREGRFRTRTTPGGVWRLEVDDDGWPIEHGKGEKK
jgi:excisionase family DNA binding protein